MPGIAGLAFLQQVKLNHTIDAPPMNISASNTTMNTTVDSLTWCAGGDD